MRSILKIFAIYILFQTAGFGCTCPIPISFEAIQEYEYENSTDILLIEVLDIDRESGSFYFEIIEVLKGGLKSRQKFNGVYDKQCGPSVTEIGKWLAYGSMGKEKKFSINACGLSRSLKHPEYNVNAEHKPPPPPPFEPSTSEEKRLHHERTELWKKKNVALAKSNLEDELNNLRNKRKQ